MNMVISLLSLPKFSIEALPIILFIILILVLFTAVLWLILSKIPDPTVQGWAKWIAAVIGGILLLWYLVSLL